ncbi:MAG: phosphoenolpyruvate--protein phosphotransferase [Candidatus Marinimicrobia bacterium]|nr:phosphoenolpyruvate--protein phosphotransferase [Candidatus Neomarinimicrobiota bacterium]
MMPAKENIRGLSGISASPGIAFGEAYIRKQDSDTNIARTIIPVDKIEDEIKKLKKAQDQVAEELEILRKKVAAYLGPSYSDIILAQLTILRDAEILREVRAYMKEHHVNAAFAYRLIVNQYLDILEEQSSEYFKERVADIRDIKRRVLRALITKKSMLNTLRMEKPVIFIARELSPTDIMMLVSENVRGFITEFGGRTSHVAIMARTLKVPMLIGVEDLNTQIQTGDELILDAGREKVWIRPDAELREHYQRELRLLQEQDRHFRELSNQKAVTRDAYHLRLSANISLPIEVKDVLKYGAEGIGLYRTEYLYMMKHQLPEEEELFREYRHVMKSVSGLPVIMRTLDFGGDKMSALENRDIHCEENPFMGYRAIRICLDKPQVFHTQLRAILRSSVYGKLSLMLPMITHVEQLEESLEHIRSVKDALEREGIPFDPQVPVGMMIETPSAVMNIRTLAEKVDFFSIGTNDLTQYVLAVDRGNERVNKIYDHYDPAVIRMIRIVTDAARKQQIPVYICGEMASEPAAVLLFLALGVDGISVATRYIGAIREFVMQCDRSELLKILDPLLAMNTRREITEYLDSQVKKILQQ